MITVSAITEAFLKEDIGRRITTLQTLSEQQRATLFEDWAKVCSLTDVVELLGHDKGLFYQMERVLCGDRKRGLPKTQRTFYLMANPDFEPAPGAPRMVCQIELPMRKNVRQWMTIDNPVQLPIEHALRALVHFGQHATPARNKNALIEITEREFLLYRTKKLEREQQAEAERLADDKALADAASDARQAALEKEHTKRAEAEAERIERKIAQEESQKDEPAKRNKGKRKNQG